MTPMTQSMTFNVRILEGNVILTYVSDVQLSNRSKRTSYVDAHSLNNKVISKNIVISTLARPLF
jgi:hypothetical protein